MPASTSSQGSRHGHRAMMRRNDIHASDLSSPRRFIEFDHPSHMSTSSSSSAPPSEAGGEPLRIIWGTNVSIQECANNFRNFLMSFQYKYRKALDGREQFIDDTTDEESYYVRQLTEMRELGTTNLNLDARNLLAYKPTEELYHQLLNYPQEVISIMDQTIKDCMVSLVVDNNIDYDLDVKVFPDMTYNILDEDEYDDHRKSMNYPKEIDSILKEYLNTLLHWIHQRKGPFAPEFVDMWYERYLRYTK